MKRPDTLAGRWAFICAACCASASAATPDDDAWQSHPVALEAHLGIATPVGAIGMMLDVAPVSWLSLSCGFGVSTGGVQTACMGRPRLVIRRSMGVHVGAGASMGAHEQNDLGSYGVFGVPLAFLFGGGESPPDYTTYTWERTYWTNFEGGFEKRWDDGFALRGYIGLAHMLNFEDREYHLDDDPEAFGHPFDDPKQNLIYAGATAGYAF